VLSPEERARESKYRRSILDFVTTDTKKLETTLGPSDKRKLGEYLSSIREIERQLEKAEKDNAQIDPKMPKPYGVPADFADWLGAAENVAQQLNAFGMKITVRGYPSAARAASCRRLSSRITSERICSASEDVFA